MSSKIRYQTLAIKCAFIGTDGKSYVYEYQGGTYADKANWLRVDGEEIHSQRKAVESAKEEAIEKINQQKVTPDMLSQETKDLINASGGSTITNNADGTDLASAQVEGMNVIRFADRKHEPSKLNGLGRVYLRADIQNGKRTLTQDMMSQENTVFVVRDNLDLNGATINVPAKCTIQFDGGNFSNGVLNMSNTNIVADSNDVVFYNVKFSGTCDNRVAHSMWFNLIGDDISTEIPSVNEHDKLINISSFINCCVDMTFEFKNRTYGFGHGGNEKQVPTFNHVWYGHYSLYINNPNLKNLKLNFNNSRFVNLFSYYVGLWSKENGVMKPEYDKDKYNSSYWTEGGGFIYVKDAKNLDIAIENLYCNMRREIFKYGGNQFATQNNIIISISEQANVIIRNTTLENAVTDGLYLDVSGDVEVDNLCSRNNVRCGFSITNFKDIYVHNSKFINNGQHEVIGKYEFEKPWCNMNIELRTNPEFHSYKAVIDNCYFYNPRIFHLSATGNYDSIHVNNCCFESEKNVMTFVINALKTAVASNNTFINSTLNAINVNNETSKEIAVISNSTCYTKNNKVSENYIAVNLARGSIDKSDGCIFNGIEVFLYDKFIIHGSNIGNDKTRFEGLRVHILEPRTSPVFLNFIHNIPSDLVEIFDNTSDADINEVVPENSVSNLCYNAYIYKKNGTKHAIKFGKKSK